MCVVSMVLDHYRDRWYERYPFIPQTAPTITIAPQVTREEFEAFRREFADMVELLKKAKIYDERTGQPDCEMDEKVEAIRRIAKVMGVDIDSVIASKAAS